MTVYDIANYLFATARSGDCCRETSDFMHDAARALLDQAERIEDLEIIGSALSFTAEYGDVYELWKAFVPNSGEAGDNISRFTTRVYHWTTRESAIAIQETGLRKGSFVCKAPHLWKGEVCFEVYLICKFDQDGTFSWQAHTASDVPPSGLRIIGYGDGVEPISKPFSTLSMLRAHGKIPGV